MLAVDGRHVALPPRRPCPHRPRRRSTAPVPEVEVFSIEQVMRRYNQRLFRLAFATRGRRKRGRRRAPGQLRSRIRAAVDALPAAPDSGTWLARIVRNQAIDHLRVRQARQAAIALEAELPLRDGSPTGPWSALAAPASETSPEFSRSRDEVRDSIAAGYRGPSAPFPRRVHAARGRGPVRSRRPPITSASRSRPSRPVTTAPASCFARNSGRTIEAWRGRRLRVPSRALRPDRPAGPLAAGRSPRPTRGNLARASFVFRTG